MRITKLILEGYVRLLYAGIKRVVYTPESEYQLIIGTNGSGKSSLVSELSPLPASKQDYLSGGLKHVELDHNGVHYVLISDFRVGNKHTFICNNEVLNDEGTGATQKELVFEHFKYTTELHQLLTGDLRITRMAPQQRRDWISRACSYDVTFALNLYNKMKSALRDATGARKHAETRLAVEYKGLYSDEELQGLQDHIERLSTTITDLMFAADQRVAPRAEAQRRLEEAMAELKSLASDRILKMDTEMLRSQNGIESIRDRAQAAENMRRNAELSLAERRREFMEIEDTLQQMTAMAGTGGNNLSEERDALKEKLKGYFDHRADFDFGESDFIYLHRIADEMDTAITDKLLALPPNKGKRYNRVALEDAQKKHDELVAARNVKATELTRLISRKETIEGASKTECPKCGYTWVPGVSENDLRIINEKVELLNLQLTQVNDAYVKNQAWLDELNEWRRLFMDFRNLIGANQALAVLWREFATNDLIFDEPNACVHLFYRWKEQLRVLAERTRIENRIDEIETVLKRATEISGGGSTAFLTTRARQLEDLVATLTHEEQNWRRQREELQVALSQAIEWEGLKDKLAFAVENVQANMRTLLSAQLNEQYRISIDRQQGELAQLSYQLNERRAAKEVVASLERQRDDLMQKEADFKELIEHMSPTSGLIADQLSSCIDALIQQMNDFIACVWTYDMVILPCGLDGADLDYKFPIEIKGRPRHVPDISKGSGAQQDFIDFTFVLVYLSFTELHGYPLFPDELGATFDPEHRIRVVEFFKQLVDSKRTSQIFYISHNPEAHAVLVNANVTVMDSSNVGDVPNANSCLVIEYAA